MEPATVNRCQGTPWSEKLDGEKLHGAAGCDINECTVSSKSSDGQDINSTSIYKNVVLCCFYEVVFLAY